MNRQRGQIMIYAAVALVLITIGAGALWAYNRAITENAVLSGNLANTQQALQDQLNENYLQGVRQRQTDELLAKRQGAREATAEIERKIDAKLDRIYRESPEARAWRDRPIPADVLRGVRNEPDRPANGNSAGIPPAKPADAPGNR